MLSALRVGSQFLLLVLALLFLSFEYTQEEKNVETLAHKNCWCQVI